MDHIIKPFHLIPTSEGYEIYDGSTLIVTITEFGFKFFTNPGQDFYYNPLDLQYFQDVYSEYFAKSFADKNP